jgi:hypothetical protein
VPSTPPRHARWLTLAATVWAVLTLWLFSDGAVAVAPDMIVLYVGGAALAFGTLVTLVTGSTVRWSRPRRRWVALAYPVFLIALVAPACRYGAPFAARFALGRVALDQAAVQASSGEAPSGPRWIGTFRVARLERVGDAARFTIGPCSIDEDCGLLHRQQGEPPRRPGESVQHLAGPWWRFAVPRSSSSGSASVAP